MNTAGSSVLRRHAAAAAFVLILGFFGLFSFLTLRSPSTSTLQIAYLDADGGVWLVDVNRSTQWRLMKSPCRWGHLAWSSAGDRLACFDPPGREDLTVVVVVDGEGRPLREVQLPGLSGWLWSPTGRHAASFQRRGQGPRSPIRHVVTDADGRVLATFPGSDTPLGYMTAWSPDGSSLAYLAPGQTIKTYEIASGQHRVLYPSAQWCPSGCLMAPDAVLGWVGRGAVLLVGGDRYEYAPGQFHLSKFLLRLDTWQKIDVGDELLAPQPFHVSPDGWRLVWSEPSRLAVLDLRDLAVATFGHSKVFPSEALPFDEAVAFSRDGSTLYWYEWATNAIYQLRGDGTQPRRLRTLPTAPEMVKFSPDVQIVAYSAGRPPTGPGDASEIWAASLRGNDARRIAAYPNGIARFEWRPGSMRGDAGGKR